MCVSVFMTFPLHRFIFYYILFIDDIISIIKMQYCRYFNIFIANISSCQLLIQGDVVSQSIEYVIKHLNALSIGNFVIL